MICPNCGQEAEGRYCGNCGTLLRNGNGVGSGREKPEGETVAAAESEGLLDNDFEWLDVAESVEQTAAERRSPCRAEYRQMEEPERKERERKPKAEKKPRAAKGDGKSAKSPAAKNDKPSRKEKKAAAQRQKDEQELRQLLKEQKALSQEALRKREREEQDQNGGDGQDRDENGFVDGLGKLAVTGMAGVLVLAARVTQVVCCLLMAAMTVVAGLAFWNRGQSLGNIETLLTDRNYTLAVYVGIAGTALFFGAVWSLWILTRKAAGGGFRLKTYDTGRGFFPFLLCLAAVALAGYAGQWIPADEGAWKGLAEGILAAIEAIDSQRQTLLSMGILGAVLSFVRKLLRV